MSTTDTSAIADHLERLADAAARAGGDGPGRLEPARVQLAETQMEQLRDLLSASRAETIAVGRDLTALRVAHAAALAHNEHLLEAADRAREAARVRMADLMASVRARDVREARIADDSEQARAAVEAARADLAEMAGRVERAEADLAAARARLDGPAPRPLPTAMVEMVRVWWAVEARPSSHLDDRFDRMLGMFAIYLATDFPSADWRSPATPAEAWSWTLEAMGILHGLQEGARAAREGDVEAVIERDLDAVIGEAARAGEGS